MAHKGVGDRADDTHRAVPDMRVQDVLEVEDMRAAVIERLVVHAVIGGDRDDAAEFGKARQALVERPVKGERLRLVGRVAVLNVIGQREIEELGTTVFDEADTGIEHEQRQIGRIHIGLRAPDHRLDIGAAVLLFGTAIRVLRREADGALADPEATAKHRPQFILGGDRGDRHARLRDPRKDRVAAQHRGVAHHDFAPSLAVEREIARYAVHRRCGAGDDRHVVWIGEGRHRRIGDRAEPVLPPRRHRRQHAGREPGIEIGGVEAVGADDDHRAARQPIFPPVQLDHHQKVAPELSQARTISSPVANHTPSCAAM